MNNLLPKISIVTVSFNQGRYIEENILSIIEQDYPNLEHIIIDAGSTDETISILKKYPHLNWISEPDNGQSDGLNKGFKKATGEIIGWINSDDKLVPDSLKTVADFFINNPNEVAVVGDQEIIDDSSKYLRTIKSREYTHNYLLNYATGITQNSTFFKKSIFEQIGYINEDLNFAMDFDLFTRIASIRKIPYIDITLAAFRMQAEAKTSLGVYYFAKESLKIRKKYQGSKLSPGNLNDIYVIITEPLRRIRWLRNFIKKTKQKVSLDN